jgi:hypothetical protein
MAYTSGDTIEAAHYNGFVTSVNAIWSTGSNNKGIGQSALSTVSAGNTVTASQWSTLLNTIRSISDHYGQDGSITIDTVSNPSAGTTISAYSTIASDITTITNAQTSVGSVSAGYQSAVTHTISNGGNFQNTFTARARLTFANANSARWFWNAGGRLYFSTDLSGHTSDSKANEWNNLASEVGTYYMYNTTSGKSGGSGTPNTNNTNAGYWDSPNGLVFRQYENTGPYTSNRIDFSIFAPSAGSATTMDFQYQWVDDAADQTSYNKNIYNVLDQVNGTKYAYFSKQEPATTYISDTWGNPSWSTVTNTIS